MGVREKKSSYYLRNAIALLLFLVLTLAVTYAWLTLTLKGTKTNSVIVGTLSLELDDTITDGIYLENATPVSDNTGLSYDPYKFSLTNDGNVPSNYIIYLDNEEISEDSIRMKDEYVRYSLIKNNESQPLKLLSSIVEDNSKVLDKGTLEVGKTNTYDLRLWIDKDVDNSVMTTVFSGRIRVEAEQIKEDNCQIVCVDTNK